MADDALEEYSSQEQELPKVKKRRLHGACDTCRKRKIKCDSAVRAGNICTNCEVSAIPCTHDIPRHPKKKDAQLAYIKTLEERLAKMELLLQTLHPDRDVDILLDLPLNEISETVSSISEPADLMSLRGFSELKYPGTPHLASALISDENPGSHQDHPEDAAEEAQDLVHIEFEESIKHLFIDEQKRFFGQSSPYMFAQCTVTARNEVDGTPRRSIDPSQLRRPLYWDLRPWELSFANAKEKTFVYPEADLLDSLVLIYFEGFNIHLPILHQPTFLRLLRDGHHLRDPGFGMTVLLVCAVASRYTSDKRVVLDGDDIGLSSGWKYFSQVPFFRNHLFQQSTIYDLQSCALSVIYLSGTSNPHVSWVVLGLGIRLALEKGIHRRKGKSEELTPKRELAKRAFWCLICLDRWMSSFFGRPCAILDDDFDVEYPVECDDEYWETDDPDKAFKQPAGKPSRISAFIAHIRLAEILGFALRTLYSTKKSKMLVGLIGNEWECQVVTELDSSMNKWKDSLPHYLRWNPENSDPVFLRQSLGMHLPYYYLQILIHRPYLQKQSPLSLPSLAICTNAARFCSHLLEVGLTTGLKHLPIFNMSAFASALVLLFTHFIRRQSDPNHDSSAEMKLVEKCFLWLKESERKWHAAGRFVDIIQALGYLYDTNPNPRPKRRHESNEEQETFTSQTPSYISERRKWDSSIPAKPSQLPQPIPFVSKMDSEAPFDTASAMPTNNWDFSNLLMAGYIQQQQLYQSPGIVNIGNNIDIIQLASNNSPSYVTEPSVQRPSASQEVYQPFSPDADPLFSVYNTSMSNTDSSSPSPNLTDIFETWSSLPASFSTQEWERYLSEAML